MDIYHFIPKALIGFGDFVRTVNEVDKHLLLTSDSKTKKVIFQ